MNQDRELAPLIEPVLGAMGYALVRVLVSGKERPVVQVMVERGDGKPMSVEDCAAIARVLSAKLDVEDPIAGPYTLEVSSPGIDRPLVKPADYARFAGFEARVEMRAPLDGRRRFSGRIRGASATHVKLQLAEGEIDEIDLPFADITRAKLVLTDELIAARTLDENRLRH